MKKIMTSAEAGRLLKVSRQRVSLLCAEGTIKSIKISGRLMPYVESVEKYQSRLSDRMVNAPKSGDSLPRYLRD